MSVARNESYFVGKKSRLDGKNKPILKQSRSAVDRESVILGIVTSILSFVVSLWVIFHVGFIQTDGVSRVMNAYYTMLGNSFHLAAVGFVWNPLPSLVEIPILLLHSLIPSLLTYGLAGNVMSSFFAGITTYFVNRILTRFGVGRWVRIVLSILFFLNPMILFYNGDGMSESSMLASLLGALEGMIAYIEGRKLGYLVRAGIWLAIGFSTRYEAVPFAVFMVGLAVIGMWRSGWKIPELEAVLIALAFPITVSGITWIYFNWIIMGDPFFFANSTYSNAAQQSSASQPLIVQLTAHHFVQAISWSARFGSIFPPVFFFFAIVMVSLFRKKPDPRAYALIGATIAIPALQTYLMYKGLSSIQARYFIMYIPSAFLMAGYLIPKIPRRVRWAASSAFIVFLLWGNWVNYQVQTDPILGRGDTAPFTAIKNNTTLKNDTTHLQAGMTLRIYNEEKVVAAYINAHPQEKILLDTFDGFGIIPFLNNPNQVLITSDTDFSSILNNPRGRINAFLVPEPVNSGALDAVNQKFPGLYEGKVPWVKLTAEFNDSYRWRLYEILSNAP